MPRIRKKKAVDKDVLTLARERVAHAFGFFDTIAVSFSGGKDSTAVLNLAIEYAEKHDLPPVITFFFDEEAIPYETEAYVRRMAAHPKVDLRWYCLPVQHRNACSMSSPLWYPWAPEDKDKWVRPLPPEAITHVEGWPELAAHRPSMPDAVGLLFPALKYGRTGMFMGIRSDESLTRTRAILMDNQDNRPYIKKWDGGHSGGNLFKVLPVYDWSTADIWTAPAKLGWDVNIAYDHMEMAGMSHNDQRCAPPYGEEPMRGLWTFAVCFPDIWPKMQERVPGAATAARYSKTTIYSYGKSPEKPADMTWHQFLQYWIDRHNPDERAGVAGRVAGWLKQHYKKTHQPLAVRCPHPVTGVCWNFLLTIAVRGDYKGRKQPSMAPVDKTKAIARYDAEIAEMRKSGELV